MKNPTLRFELRTDREKNGKLPIVIKIYADGKNKYISSPFKINKKEWYHEKERTFHNIVINSYLDQTSTKFHRYILDNPGCNDLEKIAAFLFSEFEGTKISLINYTSFYIKAKKLKNDVKPKTISRYERMFVILKRFLAETNKNGLPLAKVNLEFINGWDTYIKSTLTINERHLGLNTLNKYHSLFRTVLLQAFNEGKLNVNPYSMMKLKGKPCRRSFLTDEELSKIKSSIFNTQKIEKVRLIYLFSCYTGIRFADAQQLLTTNLKRTNTGDLYLSFVSAKTFKQQEVPLLEEASAVISEMADLFSKELNITGRLLPKISNQKFNDYIKLIAAQVGIDKELTHHTARHTFATYMLNRGVSLPALQVLLGHSNLRETMIYTKITPGYLVTEVAKGNKGSLQQSNNN